MLKHPLSRQPSGNALKEWNSNQKNKCIAEIDCRDIMFAGISFQTSGQKNSRAPLFSSFMHRSRHYGDAYLPYGRKMLDFSANKDSSADKRANFRQLSEKFPFSPKNQAFFGHFANTGRKSRIIPAALNCRGPFVSSRKGLIVCLQNLG